MTEHIYDVIVIGAGPGGLMAAGIAAANGRKVLILEKNSTPGKKLLITGKGRCNITNGERDFKAFCNTFGIKGKFLYSAMSRFTVENTIDFFESNGCSVKTERGNRIFPQSDKADSVLDVLLKEVKSSGGQILYSQEVTDIIFEDEKYILTTVKKNYLCHKVILATGGLSYPATGSTGEGFNFAEKLGHRIIPTLPGLVPLISSNLFIKDLQGVSLKNVAISLWSNNKKHDELFGEALFTHKGLSGPIILDLSSTAEKLLQNNKSITASIDFKPALEFEKLNKRILRDIEEAPNKLMKNIVQQLLPGKLVPVIIRECGINGELPGHQFSKSDRKKLVHYLKDFKVTITAIGGFNQAIITRGGVDLKEIDPRTMESKKKPGLFFTGEILDLDGPTGGYNLQVCWSTGYVAGSSV